MWRERIGAARARGTFTEEDRFDAGKGRISAVYGACAVGEQADRYGAELFFEWPRKREGVLDEELKELGGHFCGCVVVNDFDGTERTLDQIEDRALELKRGGPC